MLPRDILTNRADGSDHMPDIIKTKTQEAIATLNNWAEAIRSRDIERVINLYHPATSQLLGTVDESHIGSRIGRDRIRHYFEHFLANDVVEPKILNREVIVLSDNIVVVNGYYDFRLVKAGVEKIAHAKFTFIFQRNSEGQLEIVTHNSGLTPQGIEIVPAK